MMTACMFCSSPGLPWEVRFVNPGHVYFAWGIVIIALFLAVLPFLLGYRLGPRIPYRVKNHLKFFALFAVVLMGWGWMSFGGSLAMLLSWGDMNLILILSWLTEMAVNQCWLSGAEHSGLFMLPGAIAGHALYTWIITLIDRPLIKPEKKETEAETETENRIERSDLDRMK